MGGTLDDWQVVREPGTEDTEVDKTEEYTRVTALLRHPSCRYAPHMMHCVPVLPGTVLVVISEVRHGHTLMGMGILGSMSNSRF